jgi:hypothetical protein
MVPPAAKGGSFEKPPPLESPTKLFIKKTRAFKKKVLLIPIIVRILAITPGIKVSLALLMVFL